MIIGQLFDFSEFTEGCVEIDVIDLEIRCQNSPMIIRLV